MRRSSLLLVVTACVLLGAATGCGDDDAAAPPSTDGTTTSSGGDVITSSSTTTTAGSGDCADPPPLGEEVIDPPVRLDADGDGAADEAQVFVVDDGALELSVTYASGGRTVVTYDDDSIATFAAVRVDRVADVDGDGDDDLWLVVGAGASTQILSLVLADGCDLVRPDVGGTPNQFAVGASVGFSSGIECTDLDGDGALDGFLQHEGENAGGSTYEGTTTSWQVTGAEEPSLERGGSEPFRVDVETGDFTAYAGLDCS